MDISCESALAAIKAVRDKSQEIGSLSNIAVVDSAAHLVAFLRMDNAMLGSADVAIRKARTAVLFSMSTEALGELARPGQPLYGIENTNGGLVLFGGGAPIKDAGAVVGAIGVSGSSVEIDTMLAGVGARNHVANG
jgi:uncharacterized protein GlcG (DUF336 family)